MLGRRLERVFPVPFLAGDRALAVAVMSYDGGMNFGLLADYDALPDLDELTEGLEASLAELRDLAGGGPLGRRAARPRARASAPARRRARRRPRQAPSRPTRPGPLVVQQHDLGADALVGAVARRRAGRRPRTGSP